MSSSIEMVPSKLQSQVSLCGSDKGAWTPFILSPPVEYQTTSNELQRNVKQSVCPAGEHQALNWQ